MNNDALVGVLVYLPVIILLLPILLTLMIFSGPTGFVGGLADGGDEVWEVE